MQICVNFQKYWNNAMSNDGLIIENMDLSHIHLAVSLIFWWRIPILQTFLRKKKTFCRFGNHMHCWVVVEGCKLIYCNQDKCLNLELYEREEIISNHAPGYLFFRRIVLRGLILAPFVLRCSIWAQKILAHNSQKQ